MPRDTTALVPPPGEVDLYIVRHGQTRSNRTHTVQGFMDSPLTDDGIAQAKQVGKGLRHIPFVAAFSSDLGRQKDSAKYILAENRHPAPLGLREWCMGAFEGGTVRDLWGPVFREYGLSDEDQAAAFRALLPMAGLRGIADTIAKHDTSGRAETFEAIAASTREAIDHIVAASLASGGGNALVVSSGMKIRTILTLYAPDGLRSMDVPNCSLSVLRYASGKCILLKAGDVGHLAQSANDEDAGTTV